MTDSTQLPPATAWIVQRERAITELDAARRIANSVLDPESHAQRATALAMIAQTHATLALVELLRELQHDFRDLRRDVHTIARQR